MVILAAGSAWSFSSPLMAVPDEPAHVARAVAVVHGQWTMRFHTVPLPGGLTEPVTDIKVAQSYATLGALPACYAFHPSRPASCAPELGPDGNVVAATTYVGTYPPTYYLLTGWPSLLFDARTAIPLMRLCTIAMSGAFVASGLMSYRSRRDSQGTARSSAIIIAGAALALTPVAMMFMAAVNPNGLEIAAAFCVWLTALAIGEQIGHDGDRVSGRLLVRFALSGGLMVLIRPLSPVMFVAILALVALAVMTRGSLRRVIADRRMLLALGVVSALTMTGELLAVVSHSSTAIITSPMAGTSDRGAFLRESLRQTPDWLRQLIGRLGWLDTPLPALVVWGWIATCVGLVLVAAALTTWRGRLVLATVVGATLVGPIAAQVISGPTVGMGWQGRYGLPVAIGIPIVAAWLIARSNRLTARVERVMCTAIISEVAFGQLSSIIRLLNRYSNGVPSTWLRFLHMSGGIGVWNWTQLGVLATVTTALLGAWLLVLCLDGSPTIDLTDSSESSHLGDRVDVSDSDCDRPTVSVASSSPLAGAS